ncbi:MAG: c-type cytochrome [Burkholderiaceae bacterium]|nr:c-type cytochrome [Burkholderiaceae bacterium]
MSDEHQSFINTPRQLITVVVLAFLVPIVVITLIATYVQTTKRTGTGADAMTPEAIATRLQPVGRLEVAGAQSAGTAATQNGTPAAGAAPAAAAATAAAAPAPAAPAAAAPAAAAPATTAPAAGEAAPKQASAGDVAAGEKIYKGTCGVCHESGVAGAPKHGDKAAWKPRLAQGVDVLDQHAIHGIRAMPPRGGNGKLTDQEVRDAVAYMLAAVR